MCLCVWERERVCECGGVELGCVWKRERDREIKKDRETNSISVVLQIVTDQLFKSELEKKYFKWSFKKHFWLRGKMFKNTIDAA